MYPSRLIRGATKEAPKTAPKRPTVAPSTSLLRTDNLEEKPVWICSKIVFLQPVVQMLQLIKQEILLQYIKMANTCQVGDWIGKTIAIVRKADKFSRFATGRPLKSLDSLVPKLSPVHNTANPVKYGDLASPQNISKHKYLVSKLSYETSWFTWE